MSVSVCHLIRKFGRLTVHNKSGVADNLLDGALSLEILEHLSCNGAVDLHSIDEDGDGDEAVCLHILVKLLIGGFVEDDCVIGLVLD